MFICGNVYLWKADAKHGLKHQWQNWCR